MPNKKRPQRKPTARTRAKTLPPPLERIFKYDFAFSFLSRDVAIAREVARQLKPLESFVYTERQGEVAFRDGVDAYSRIFRKESRIAVILYRQEWGTTKYTEVEANAFKSRGLELGWESMYLIRLDGAEMPIWYPTDIKIYFDLAKYGLKETIGAIRRRSEERGATLTVETVIERERRLAVERVAERTRASRALSQEGFLAGQTLTAKLFETVRALVDEFKCAVGDVPVEVEADATACVVRTPKSSFVLVAEIDRDGAFLRAEGWFGTLALHHGHSRYAVLREGQKATEAEYRVGLSELDEWGYKSKRGTTLTPRALAESMIDQLMRRFRSGPSRERYGTISRGIDDDPPWVDSWRYR